MVAKNERGAVMLEATYCIFISVVILMFLLSFGFFLYQKTMFRIAATEIAEEVAQTYKLRYVEDSSDLESSDISGVGKYRYFLFSSSFKRKNEERAKALVEERMKQTSFAKGEGAYLVSVEPIVDDIGRRHYNVTVSKQYSFLLGDLLKLVGIDRKQMLETTVYVESVDVLSYANTIRFTKYGIAEITSKVGVLKLIDSAISLLSSIFS